MMPEDYHTVIRALLFGTCMLFSLCSCLPKAVEVPFMPKEILIYGGNGFIGSSTVEKFITAGHKLTLVSRGNWYWNSAFTVKPFVHHIICDRMQSVEKCTDLLNYMSSVEKIDAVIDFSAYHPQCMSDTLDLLKRKAQLYIYISTDSVYEVCLKNHTGPTKETDAVRPFSKEDQEKLASQDSYGHRKLQCEEVLADYRQNKYGPPFIALRLPDVIGPRDNSYRWWIYQMWMKLRPYLDKDVVVPSSLASQSISFVYVNDVAELIFQLVQKPNPAAMDEAFNLAQHETFTLKKMLEDMKEELNLTDVNILTDSNPLAIHFFPSVRLGVIDISKAVEILKWSPAKWKTALKETVNFYETAIKIPYFDRQRKDIIRTVQMYFTSKPQNVIRGLKNVYAITFDEHRDEL